MKSRFPLVALAVVSLGLPRVATAGDYIVVLKDDVHAGAVTDSGAAAAARPTKMYGLVQTNRAVQLDRRLDRFQHGAYPPKRPGA